MKVKELTCEECKKQFIPTHNHFKNRKFCNIRCSNNAIRLIKDPKEKYFREKITRLKSNAKKRNIEMLLTWQDLLNKYNNQNGKCFYTGKNLQLTYSTKTRKVCPPDQLSVDRLDSNKGYNQINTVLCCYAINNFKGDLTLNEFQEYLRFLNQKPLKVKFKKLDNNAITPKYAYNGDGAVDLVATSIYYNRANGYFEYGTNLSFEIPEGFVGLIFPRSSICNKDMILTNHVGVIDSNYRGEVKFKFKGTKDRFVGEHYKIGDKVGQMIIIPYPQIQFQEVNELGESIRGHKGWGSSDT